MNPLEFVVRLLASAILAHWLRGVPVDEVEHGDGDEAWCGGVEGERMRPVEPYIYKRGDVWWAYSAGRRWSLRTRDQLVARGRLADGAPATPSRPLKRSRRTLGFVYFIRHGAAGPIKIGRAVNVAKRLGCMQTGAPERLALLATVPGGPPEERALLRRFRPLRIRGEWFRPEPELLAYIAQVRAA